MPRFAWMLRVYAAGLIATVGIVVAWEALGWWGVPFGLPLAGALLVALIDDSVNRALARAGGSEDVGT